MITQNQTIMVQQKSNDLQLNIDPALLKPLFERKPHRHYLALISDWTIIFATVYCCLLYFNFLTYLLAMIIIGARMHALVLLMHDAAHYRFLKDRKWNDLITNVLIIYPFFTTVEAYRCSHMRHHLHLNTEHDPDWVAKLGKEEFRFPKTKKAFICTVLSYLILCRGISPDYS